MPIFLSVLLAVSPLAGTAAFADSPSSDASLKTVLSQDITTGDEDGTIEAPKTATINVDNSVATVSKNDITAADKATVSFYGTDSTFATEDEDGVDLTEGENENIVYIKVTSEDGNASIYYMITINRAATAQSHDASLKTVLSQDITTTGDEDGTIEAPRTATINVDNSVATVSKNDITAADKATVSFYGTDSTFATETKDEDGVDLAEGENTVYIKVTSEDGNASICYKITINRVAATPVTSASITGTAKVGETLTASANEGATNVAYQWKECDTADGDYNNIEGATTSTYVPTAKQVGKFIKVTISGDNSSSATSEATAAVEAAAPDYTLSINKESKGGVGYTRTITVGGTENLKNKYLVTAITEGSGDNAKVSVVMFALTGTTASVSYQTKGATVETWIVSANSMPKFTNGAIDGKFDAHATTAD